MAATGAKYLCGSEGKASAALNMQAQEHFLGWHELLQ